MVLVTVATATPQTAFSIINLLGIIVFVGIFWLFQRWLRGRVSPRRRERWAEEIRLEQERLDRLDRLDAEGGPERGRDGL